MMDSYTETGGARIGRSYWLALHASYPLATLTVTADFIELQVKGLGLFTRGNIRRFPRSSIVRLTRKRGLFSQGLRIEHSLANTEPYMLFWSFNIEKT